MPKELAIRNRLRSNPRCTGDMAVEVNFQRRDSDSRQAVRVLPATGCAILRGAEGRSEADPKISIMVEFIVVSWVVVCAVTTSCDRFTVCYRLQMDSGPKVSGFQKKTEYLIRFRRWNAALSGFGPGAG
jgi:hypothetical protein